MPKIPRVPKYRHQKARGLAVVRIGGKDHYLGPWKSKASYIEYDRLVAEWMANGRTVKQDAATDPKNTLTIVELIAKYIAYLKLTFPDYAEPTSVPAKTKPILKRLCDMYGNELVCEFGPLKLKALRQTLVDSGMQSRKFINENVNRIRAMFRWGVGEELIHTSVLDALLAVEGLRKGRTAAKEGKKIEPVSFDQVEAVLPLLPPIVSDMVRLALLSGCRMGEVCDMRPQDIDRSQELWVYRPFQHKTQHHQKNRSAYLGPKSQAILAPYLLRDATAFCFSPLESERKRREERHRQRKTPLNEGNRPGRSNRKRQSSRQIRERYSTDVIRRAIHRTCEKAGIECWSPNQLRHARATEIRAKYGLEGSQVILGHENARITEMYAERDAKLAQRIAREVG